MDDIITIETKISDARLILQAHGVNLPKYGEIILWMIINNSPSKKVKIIGYGENAKLVEIEE